MTGLPKLPGYDFQDPTRQRFHLCQTFDYINGYSYPKQQFSGPGNTELDVNSVGYVTRLDPLHYDPTLTYGRSRSKTCPLFVPHYALYDKKCLAFKAYFNQAVVESPLEYYRVRQVNIIYFLEDDTLTVIEPKTPNSGMDQGRIVKRSKVLKNNRGDFWHWKDLNIGKDICIFGIVYHTVDCDTFTREYLQSQGVVICDAEQMPADPYTQEQVFSAHSHFRKTPSANDKFRRFLEYDRKILKFCALWDDRDNEHGEIRPYEILFFLADNTIAVNEVMENMEGRDPFPQLLRKTKLPKIWTQRPVDYPSIYLELTENEVSEYYQPRDFRIGETIFVLGRRMLIYDCDAFTRNYFKKVLNYDQGAAIDVKPKPVPKVRPRMPPHVGGVGSLEDSLQSTLMMMPTPPKKDVIRQVTNANKSLRYQMKFDAVHPEDTIRRFIMMYNLGDGTCYIYEPRIKNSGIIGGKYLRSTMLVKPESDPLDPDYYTPVDFRIGAVISVYRQRFIIIGADLYVYRYMQENSEKFPCEVIENMRNYMFNQGLLTDDLQDQVDENAEQHKKAERDAIGRDLEKTTTEMEKCLDALNIGDGATADQDAAKKAQILAEYEQSIKHTHDVPPYGIKPVNNECQYPVQIGEVKPIECTDMADFSEFTPKHIDTPEEAKQKHYDAILEKHKGVCETGHDPICNVPQPIGLLPKPDLKPKQESPLMVQTVQLPKGACRIRQVRFAEGPERCERDRYDLCDLKTDKIPCDCTNYYQKC